MTASVEDWLYFWRKSRKALKSPGKPGKNTENLAGNQKMPFWSQGKLKKSAESREKHIFYAESQKQTPYSLSVGVTKQNNENNT